MATDHLRCGHFALGASPSSTLLQQQPTCAHRHVEGCLPARHRPDGPRRGAGRSAAPCTDFQTRCAELCQRPLPSLLAGSTRQRNSGPARPACHSRSSALRATRSRGPRSLVNAAWGYLLAFISGSLWTCWATAYPITSQLARVVSTGKIRSWWPRCGGRWWPTTACSPASGVVVCTPD